MHKKSIETEKINSEICSGLEYLRKEVIKSNPTQKESPSFNEGDPVDFEKIINEIQPDDIGTFDDDNKLILNIKFYEDKKRNSRKYLEIKNTRFYCHENGCKNSYILYGSHATEEGDIEGIYLGGLDNEGNRDGVGIMYTFQGIRKGRRNHGRFDGDANMDYGNVKYEGTMNGGDFESGTVTYSDGAKYVGNFKDGIRNGEGKYYDSNGNLIFDGVREDGEKKYGKYIYYDDDGSYYGTYEGGFKTYPKISEDGSVMYDDDNNVITVSMREGEGTMTYSEGNKYQKYVGTWNNDKIDTGVNGIGTMFYSNGDKFEGKWRNGNRYSGSYIWSDGSKYEGDFIDGIPLTELDNNYDLAKILGEKKGVYEDGNSSHEITIYNGKLEVINESNSFIFLYGDNDNDKKPWLDSSNLRGPIRYIKKVKDNKIEFDLKSWGKHTYWTLDSDGYFNFYKGYDNSGNPVGNPLKIENNKNYNGKKFGVLDAKHVANLLNFLKNENELDNYEGFSGARNDSLHGAKVVSPISTTGGAGPSAPSKPTLKINPKSLLNNVSSHFFGLSSYDVAKFLNNDDFNRFLQRQ